jgi:hypothetical protein
MKSSNPANIDSSDLRKSVFRGLRVGGPPVRASRPLSLCLMAAATLACSAVFAQPVPAAAQADPWVPPHARQPDGRSSPSGAALQALALDKLRRRFEAADAPGFGSLSRTQARRAGLGFIDTHFERIDATRSGHVSFEELRRYLNSAR